MSDQQRPLRDSVQHSQRETSMPPAEFEPTIPACERPQTYTLDQAATGPGTLYCYGDIIKKELDWSDMQHAWMMRKKYIQILNLRRTKLVLPR